MLTSTQECIDRDSGPSDVGAGVGMVSLLRPAEKKPWPSNTKTERPGLEKR
jgi:hypothetical protein